MKKERKPMNFGSTMLAAALGVVIASVAGCLLMIVITSAMIAGISQSNSTVEEVEDDTFLKIDLAKIAGERRPDQLTQLSIQSSGLVGLNETVAAIIAAKDDKDVKGLYVEVNPSGFLSWGSAEELRRALLAFKAAGKPIVAYGKSYMMQQGYYVASVADKIGVHPSGMVDFRGIGTEVLFYKNLLDKLDVQMQLIRPASCSYKSAGETYTMDHMSPYNREQIHVYINSIWSYVVEEMGQSRKLSPEALNHMADNLSGYLPQDALKNGLVDTLCFYNDVTEILKKQYGAEHLMPMSQYIAQWKAQQPVRKDKIAVVYAEGNVVDGTANGMQSGVYGETVVKAIDEARKDKSVKAIVLRVNSPGGAVTASESMTDAVRRAKAEKPVVVSMSDVAASAGYEISCNATVIVAQPTTITGSIGVFATLPSVGKALKNKLGVTTDTALTNRNAAGVSVLRPLSHEAMRMMQRNVEEFYITFTKRVATGRGLEVRYVDSIARGRVWTGSDALRLGLVDTLGGMQTALRIAAAKAGIREYSISEYPKEKDVWSQLLSFYGDNEPADEPLSLLAKARLAWQFRATRKDAQQSGTSLALSRLQQDLLYVSEAQGLQARLPFVIVSE